MAKAVHADLPGFRQLLADSWKYYRSNFKQFLFLAIIYLLVTVVPMFIFVYILKDYEGQSVAINQLFVAIPVIVGIAVGAWYELSVILAAKNENKKLSIRELTKAAVPLMGALIWLFILTIVVSTGGFLLFIIPGVLLAILFSFGPYVLVNEKVYGLEALDRSVQYFGARFWGNLGRMALLSLIFVLFAIVSTVIITVIVDVLSTGSFEISRYIQSVKSPTGQLLDKSSSVADYIFNLFSLLFGQLSVIFTYRLYLISKQIKGTPNPLTAKRKFGYIFLAIAMPLIAMIAVLAGAFN